MLVITDTPFWLLALVMALCAVVLGVSIAFSLSWFLGSLRHRR